MLGSDEGDSSAGIPGDYGFLLLSALITLGYQLFFFSIGTTMPCAGHDF